MKSSHLKGLTLSAQALVNKLVSWSTLSQQWSGSGDTIALLEEIGLAAEPLVRFCRDKNGRAKKG
jgi:hypothetical protein